jgi:hypothetical protein
MEGHQMDLAKIALLFIVPLIVLGVLSETGLIVKTWIAWPVFGMCIVVGTALTIASWTRPARDPSTRIIASVFYAGLIIYFVLPFLF